MMFRRLILTGLLLGLTLGFSGCNVLWPTSPPAHLQADKCRSSMWLTPKETPGPFWVRHRHYLEGSSPYTGGGDYIIIDVQTGESYYWAFCNVHRRFEVSTLWALTHAAWKSHDWLLLYNCAQG
jgi:hypothetical protein